MLKRHLLSAVFAAPGEGGSQEPPAGGEAPPEGSGQEPPAGGEAPPDGSGQEPPAGGETPPAKPDWREREIARKHAQLQEAKRREQDLQAELEAARAVLAKTAGGTPPSPGDAPPAASVSPDAVKTEAARMRAQERFDEQANAADKAGREKYGDGWAKATETLKTLGGFDPGTMNQILATDDAAKVLYELGSQPEKYQDIMALPEHRRFAELIKLAMAPAAPPAPKPSGAPAPTTPIRGRNVGNPNELADDLSDEEWYKRRQAQKAARFATRQAQR